jgi:mitogen-activated protein kinase kinase kinase 1
MGGGVIIKNGTLREEDYQLQSGDVILGNPVASGAGGVVYKAVYCGKDCAVKVLNEPVNLNPNVVAGEGAVSMQREVTLLARLRHPNLVSFYGYFIREFRMYIVMEWCPETLTSLLEKGPLLPEHFVRIAKQIIRALAFLHRLNILHRDLKPSNVLLDVNGTVKIADFGLSRDMDAVETMGALTYMMGTPFYMAPEVFDSNTTTPMPQPHPGSGNESASTNDSDSKTTVYGKAADIYSFGIVCWEMYTRKKPYSDLNFSARNVLAVFDAVGKGLRPNVESFPPALGRLIQMCLSKEPRDRCTLEDIERVLNNPSLLELNPQARSFELAELEPGVSRWAQAQAIGGRK